MANKKAGSNLAPIGIFDSGIGGLTVASAIRNILPDENLVYFGDTAHLPYGDKSPDAIRSYAVRISDFLLSKGCKMIVIACNTASSVAFEKVKEHAGNRALVVDVIYPVVEHVAKHRSSHHVGIIGTRGTIRSNAYPERLLARKPSLKVVSLATPLLAPMIEEGFFNNKISRTVIHSYLARPKLKGIDTLILACTHYPLIRKEIEEYYHNGVYIVDSAEIVARYAESLLRKKNLLSNSRINAHQFFVSDYTTSFARSTQTFFAGRVKLTKNNLWE
jgi:glutamate racemase